VTVSIGDVSTPADKPEILAVYEDRANKIDKQYERGLITEDERRQELIEIWTDATSRLGAAMEANFSRTNPIYMMVHSGARGNMVQMRQIAAMRGLVVNPKGEIIARPIKSNFREGLSVLEYFISTHGCPQGASADTALRTADSGYLHPASGRRLAGRHHPPGGLRHRARSDQDDRARRRRQHA
jgi:DNA-directed RNA polymerase subunit beta'